MPRERRACKPMPTLPVSPLITNCYSDGGRATNRNPKLSEVEVWIEPAAVRATHDAEIEIDKRAATKDSIICTRWILPTLPFFMRTFLPM